MPIAASYETPVLTAVDRCDRCGAQAYVITQHIAGKLYWCSHHFSKYHDTLQHSVVLDERHLLQRRPTETA